MLLLLIHITNTINTWIDYIIDWCCCAGRIDVLTLIETDIKRAVDNVIEKAKELCKSKGVSNVSYEVYEGDARNIIVDAVEKQHATLLVMGSHGYGAFKRYIYVYITRIYREYNIFHTVNIYDLTSSNKLLFYL